MYYYFKVVNKKLITSVIYYDLSLNQSLSKYLFIDIGFVSFMKLL